MPDNTYGFESVGSNIYNGLQDLLTQKRLQARQTMLDQLNQQNIQSQIADRDENTAGLKEQRLAMADYRRSEAAKAIASNLTLGQALNPDVSSKLSPYGLVNPAIGPENGAVGGGLAINNQTNPIMSFQNPDGSTSIDPESNTTGVDALTSTAPKTKPDTFAGMAVQQLDAQSKAKMSALLGDPSFIKADPMTRWLLMRDAMPKGENPPPMDQLSGDQVPLITVDAKGQVINQGNTKKGTIVKNLPPERQGPQATVFQQPDPAHPGQILSYWLKPGEQPGTGNLINGGPLSKLPPKTPPPNKDLVDGLYSSKALSTYLNMRRGDQTKVSSADRIGSLANFVNTITDPQVKQNVDDIVNDPTLKGLSIQQLLSPDAKTGKPPLYGDPEEVRKTVSALRALGAQ